MKNKLHKLIALPVRKVGYCILKEMEWNVNHSLRSLENQYRYHKFLNVLYRFVQCVGKKIEGKR